MNLKSINIYVGNLPPAITEDELRSEFLIFGEVESVTIIDDKRVGSGQQRRFAYVEMASRLEGETAIASLEGKKIRNTNVTVIRALPLTDRWRTVPFNINSNKKFNRERKKKINN